jgi:hypothetical protein
MNLPSALCHLGPFLRAVLPPPPYQLRQRVRLLQLKSSIRPLKPTQPDK